MPAIDREIIAAGRTKKKFTSAQGGSTIDEAYDSVPYSDCKSQQEIREKVHGMLSSFVALSAFEFECRYSNSSY